MKSGIPAAILACALAVLAGGCSTSAEPVSSHAAADATTATDTDTLPAPNPTATTTVVADPVPTTTTTSPAPVRAPLVTLPRDAPLCETLQTTVAIGELSDGALVEISGIVASRTHPSVIWAHNDSGDEAIVYALATDGTLLSSHRLGDTFPLDMEDIAIGPGPDPSIDYLYVADIGDNLRFRPDVSVYRLPEPNPFAGDTTAAVEHILLAYPEPGVNSEALTVDPVTGDVFLFAKTDEGPVPMFRAPAELLSTGPVALEPAGAVGVEAGSEVTAADISATGDRIALRGYNEVWVWPRSEPDVVTTLQREPCEGASPDEVQGEALTFSADGTVIFTISEGSGAAVNRVGP